MGDFVNLWRIRHSILQKDVLNKLSDLCNLLTTKKAVLMVKNHLEVDGTFKCIENGVVTVFNVEMVIPNI